MPCSQGSKGRDHNPFTFTSWMAGGGFKGGVTYGESDEWSYKAATHPTYCYDLHATILHLLGLSQRLQSGQSRSILTLQFFVTSRLSAMTKQMSTSPDTDFDLELHFLPAW